MSVTPPRRTSDVGLPPPTHEAPDTFEYHLNEALATPRSTPAKLTSAAPSTASAASSAGRGSAARGGVQASSARKRLMDGHEPEEDMSGHVLARCSRDVLMEMVMRHQEEKDEALERIEALQTAAMELQRENGFLEQDFTSAKTRVDQLMADESRMEEELSGRIEVLDKLRSSIRDSEREQREAKKRYREQTESFDSERQSWYDQEQHYKLRITNLSISSTRRPRVSPTIVATPNPPEPVVESLEINVEPTTSTPSIAASISRSDSNSSIVAAEVAALQDQLSSLSTAHQSLTTTSRALQVELGELKRVYHDVQEENESYQLLLGERTLNGEVRGSELFRKSWASDDEVASSNYGGLESVGETDEGEDEENDGDYSSERMEVSINVIPTTSPVKARRRKTLTRAHRVASSDGVMGGGLDLAAELEAAQWADEEGDAEALEKKKRHKRDKSSGEVEVIRAELKTLREANKALTLYVSKIVDRVCSQEGFEKVLAVDFKTTPGSLEVADFEGPNSATPQPTSSSSVSPPPLSSSARYATSASSIDSNGRMFGRNASTTSTSNVTATSFKRPSPVIRQKVPTRPLSLDWKSVSSVFASALSRTGTNQTPTPAYQPTGFKPLILLDSTTLGGAARQLPTDEDEDDVRERERLRAEMALHGIVTSASGWGRPSIERSASSSASQRLSISIPNRGSSPKLGSPREGGERRPSGASDVSSEAPEVNFRRRTPDLQPRPRSPNSYHSASRGNSPSLSPLLSSNGWVEQGGLGIGGMAAEEKLPRGLGIGMEEGDRAGDFDTLRGVSPKIDSATSAESVDSDATWSKRLKRMSLGGVWAKGPE